MDLLTAHVPSFPLAVPDVSKVRTVELLLKYRADPEARAKGLHSPLMMVRKEPETWRDDDQKGMVPRCGHELQWNIIKHR